MRLDRIDSCRRHRRAHIERIRDPHIHDPTDRGRGDDGAVTGFPEHGHPCAGDCVLRRRRLLRTVFRRITELLLRRAVMAAGAAIT